MYPRGSLWAVLLQESIKMNYILGSYLKNNIFLKVLVSIDVIFNYMAFYYNGGDINKYHIVFSIFMLTVSMIYIYLKRISITRREIHLFLLLWLPISCLILIQFLYLHDISLIKTDIIILMNILIAFIVNKVIGFPAYTRLLRWMMFFNLMFIVFAVFAGRIMLDSTLANPYGTNLFLSIFGIEMEISPGSWGYDTVRIGGLFGHPNFYGVISMMAMVGLSFSRATFKTKALWWIVYCASFVVSESRASILFLFTFYILSRIFSKRTLKDVFLNLIILMMFSMISFFLAGLRDNSAGADITSGRADLMEIVWNSIMTNPDAFQLFGVGIGQGKTFLLRDVGLLLPIDNAYFLTAIEYGLLGGTLFILIWIFTWQYVGRYSNVPYFIWVPFFMGILVYGFFESTLSMDMYSRSIHWVIFLFFMITYKKYDEEKIKRDKF